MPGYECLRDWRKIRQAESLNDDQISTDDEFEQDLFVKCMLVKPGKHYFLIN